MSLMLHCPVCRQETVVRAKYWVQRHAGFCVHCKSLLALTNAPNPAFPSEPTHDAEGAQFLVPAEMSCPKCGGIHSDAAGFCMTCAIPLVPTTRDRWSAGIDGMAGASDKGIRHLRNEDCFLIESGAIATEKVMLAVVCDGISTSQDPDQASAHGCDVIMEEMRQYHDLPEAVRPVEGLSEAIRRADAAVRLLAHPASKYAPLQDPPETTAVVVQAIGRSIQVGWLGDSRAYFIGRERVQLQLSHDHSYLTQLLERGLTLTEALVHRGAHALTSCLGGPTNPGEICDAPSIVTFTAPESGWVILCTDGLWNYLPDPFQFATMARQSAHSTLRQMAIQMVHYALKAGGKDNVTVVVMEID